MAAALQIAGHFVRAELEVGSHPSLARFSLVVRPHPEHLDHALLLQKLIDEPVMNRAPARESAGQVANEFFETRRLSVRVSAEKLQ